MFYMINNYDCVDVERIFLRIVFSVVVRECWCRMQEVVIEISGIMWVRWLNRSKVNVVFCCIYKGGMMQLKINNDSEFI